MKVRFITVLLLVLLALLSCKEEPEDLATYGNEHDPTNPLLLTVGTTHKGSIEGYEGCFYRFVAKGNGSHTIALTNAQSDLLWVLFDDPDYTNVI